jgi:hypothetical protein
MYSIFLFIIFFLTISSQNSDPTLLRAIGNYLTTIDIRGRDFKVITFTWKLAVILCQAMLIGVKVL